MAQIGMTKAPKPRVYVTRRIAERPLQRVLDACDATVWPGLDPPPRGELLHAVRGAAGILALLTESIDAELLDAAGPGLRVVSNMATGVDNVDLEAAAARGVLVGRTPGVLTEATADLTFALLLSGARRLGEAVDFVRAGRWTSWGPEVLLGQELRGSTLGVVGMGAIGEAVARRARGFGMEVVYFNRSARLELERALPARRARSLEDLLEVSDFVTLHVPLTPATRHIIGRAALARMKPTAVLVNTSRGGAVDTDALVEALRAGAIAFAALDVTDPEPLPASHPLLGLDRCMVVPHIGSATRETRERMGMMAADNLLAALRGEVPPNLANPEVLERRS